MPRAREYHWYIEPLDEYSNGKVAESMVPHGIAEADAKPAVKCRDGEVHGLWECPRRVITGFKRSSDSNLKIRIWVSEGGGLPRLWTKPKARPRLPKKKAA